MPVVGVHAAFDGFATEFIRLAVAEAALDSVVGQGNVLDQVQFAYNNFAQITHDYQSHSGAVNTMSTPKVQYGYADGSANTIRPTTLTYPNGRTLTFSYGASGGSNDAASRIAAIVDDDGAATHLAEYDYLGLGSPIIVDYTEPEVRSTLVGTAGGNDPDTGDNYRGLDSFGRVRDAQWYDYGSLADAARIQYGYDRASNRTWRHDVVAAASSAGFDELYAYDGLQRLEDVQRGTLNSQHSTINSQESFGV